MSAWLRPEPDPPRLRPQARRERAALAGLLVALLAALFLASCERAGKGDAPAGPSARAAPSAVPTSSEVQAISDPHRLLVLAKLHADRDSRDGYAAAVLLLRRLVEIEPAAPTDRLNLARALFFAGDMDASGRELAEARRLFGQAAPPEVEELEALLSWSGGRTEEALARFTRVTEVLPEHEHAWYGRAQAEERLGRLEEADRSLRRVLEIRPAHRGGAYRLALLLRLRGREEEARRAMEAFRALPEGSPEDDRCLLTAVSLRPLDRSLVEPPRAVLTLAEATRKALGSAGEGMLRARGIALGLARRRGLLLAGPRGARVLELGSAPPRALDGSLPASLEAPGGQESREVLVLDLDNDGLEDAVVLSQGGLHALRQEEGPSFRLLPLEVSLAGRPVGLQARDADHDGDLDLVVLLEAREALEAVLLRNQGNLTLSRLPSLHVLRVPPAGPPPARLFARAALDAHDLDQANDLDLVLAGGPAGVHALLNLRDGRFAPVALPSLGRRTLVLAEDLDNDGAPDLFAAGGEPGWALARSADRMGAPYSLRLLEPRGAASSAAGEVHDACLADLDHDGDLEVLLAGSRGLAVLRNTRGGNLEEEAVTALEGREARAVQALDLDGDGVLEVLAGMAEGRLAVLALSTPPPYPSLRLRLQGRQDNRDGVGCVAEVFSGRSYQSLMAREAGGLHVGLGPAGLSGLDGLRLRWPQGIIQSLTAREVVVEAGQAVVVQREGLVASCPFLHGFGPQGWSFLTDILGLAPLDEWRPPGSKGPIPPAESPPAESPPAESRQSREHGELVRIEGHRLVPHQGRIRLAVTEELRESAYLDSMELLVLEHPEDRELFLDESSRQGSPSRPRLLAIPREALHAPASLLVSGCGESREAAAVLDGVYVHGYPPAPEQWGGWVERYDLRLETPAATRALLLTGRIAWPDSTVVYSLWQGGRGWGPLRLDQEEGTGPRTLIADLGLPAGMDRTLVCVLPDPVSAGAWLRLSGQHRFLWDRIGLSSEVEEIAAHGAAGDRALAGGGRVSWRTLHPARARLGYHGFSRSRGNRGRHEQTYEYAAATPDDSFPPAVGRATRYGDVTALLQAHDDLAVVLVAGDGVEVEFEAPPSPPRGAQRTWLLRVSGWAKEGGYHNRTGRSIEPLPFRAMSDYPPPRGEQRTDAAYRAYRDTYQTREVRRRAP